MPGVACRDWIKLLQQGLSRSDIESQKETLHHSQRPSIDPAAYGHPWSTVKLPVVPSALTQPPHKPFEKELLIQHD